MNWRQLEPIDRTHVVWNGRRLLFFGGCDYHRLSSHPQILKTIEESLHRDGVSTGASRTTTGDHPAYGALETQLAKFARTEAAVLTPTGFSSNLILAQALEGNFSAVLMDREVHASLRDATRFLGVPVHYFNHRDAANLKTQRAILGNDPVAVLTDGMFWFDGSLAPLADYVDVMKSGDWLWVDDAHGFGTTGSRGRGTVEQAGLSTSNRTVSTCTLSKSIGCAGGAILGSTTMVQEVWNRSSMFKGSTPVPVPWARGSSVALEILEFGTEDLSLKLHENAQRVRSATNSSRGQGPIITLEVPNRDLEQVRSVFLENGIYPAITSYEGRDSLRAVISSRHSPTELDRLAACLREWVAR